MELKNGNLTLHYDDDGDAGKPPILLLHGILQNTATWAWIVPELAADYRVVRLDFRGHGGSDRAPGTYSFPHYIADAAAVCEQVLGQPAVVMGHSLGGATAAGLAQTRPELVRGVVLEDPAIISVPVPSRDDVAFEENALFGAFKMMRESIPRLQEAGMATGVLAKILQNAPSPSGSSFGDLAHDDALHAMADGMLRVDATVLDSVFDGSSAPVFDPQRELPVPGVVVAGDPSSPDTVMRDPALSLMATHSPKVEQRVITGVGHMIHDSKKHRAQVLGALHDLLARL